MSDQSSKFSLKKEIHKRKTQEIEQVIQARRTGQTGQLTPPSAPPPARATQTTKPALPAAPGRADSARATQQTPRPSPGTATSRRTQSLPAREGRLALNRTQKLTLFGSSILIMVVCVGTLLLAGRAPDTPPTITWMPLPVSSAESALDYLKQVGFPISSVKTLSVPDDTWKAQQGVQISADNGDQKGRFLILSYESSSQAGHDAFLSPDKLPVRQWTSVQMANVLLFISPDTAPALRSDITSHLTQYLLAPYRSFLPTATPGPTAAVTPGSEESTAAPSK
jgi:hypothetical protein